MKPKPFMSLTSMISPVPWELKWFSMSALVAACPKPGTVSQEKSQGPAKHSGKNWRPPGNRLSRESGPRKKLSGHQNVIRGELKSSKWQRRRYMCISYPEKANCPNRAEWKRRDLLTPT